MFYVLMTVLTTISLVTSVPIYNLKSESDPSRDEIVYVPYDVDYIPVKVPISSPKTIVVEELPSKMGKITETIAGSDTIPILLDENTFDVLQNFKKGMEDPDLLPMSTLKLQNKNSNRESTERGSSSFDLFEDKFNTDSSKSSEDFVLVPVSVFKKYDSSHKTHVVAKRQAPGNDFRVYRPVVQFRRVFRNRRKVYRPPALVGYLNDYDNFPTVA